MIKQVDNVPETSINIVDDNTCSDFHEVISTL